MKDYIVRDCNNPYNALAIVHGNSLKDAIQAFIAKFPKYKNCMVDGNRIVYGLGVAQYIDIWEHTSLF